RAGVRREADELPRLSLALQGKALVLSRSSRALCRLRKTPSLRALGRHRGLDESPHLLAGRCAHLYAVRESGIGDLRFPRVPRFRLWHLRLYGRGDLARVAPRKAHRVGRAMESR